MDTITANTKCLALVTPGTPGAEEAGRLVRRALTDRGETPWPAAEIEVYPGVGESLILAHPAAGERVYISAGAMRVLATYFGMEDY